MIKKTNKITMEKSQEQKRFNMIEQQIRPWEVLDPVTLNLLKLIPRENYIPLVNQGLAFADLEIPLGHNEKMLSPKLEARIIQSLNLKKSDQVLHVGTGSGYFSALLAGLSLSVITLDIHIEFIERARDLHRRHKLSNIFYQHHNGLLGWKDGAPYDVIVLTGSCPKEPIGLREQLKIGGRLFLIEGMVPMMTARIILRTDEHQFEEKNIFDTVIDPLTSNWKLSSFTF